VPKGQAKKKKRWKNHKPILGNGENKREFRKPNPGRTTHHNLDGLPD
jgi:hypothetical protein